MKRFIWLVALIFLFSGCFETKFNFKTIVMPNGKIKREVEMDERGSRRFLAPAGASWQVKTFESKGSESIIEDTHYHTQAVGSFDSAGQFPGDFHYDISRILSGLTDDNVRLMREKIGIPEPFEKEIKTENEIKLNQWSHLWFKEFEYTETFRLRWVIPLLLFDIKKELIRQKSVSLNFSQVPYSLTAEDKENSPVIDPNLLSEDKLESLAQKALAEQVLPKFLFHSEIVMPGKIIETSGAQIINATAVWDFKASDFKNNFSTYSIRVKSRALDFVFLYVVSGVFLIVVLLIVLVVISRKRSGKRKPKKAKN